MKNRHCSPSSSNQYGASWLYLGVVLVVWLVPFFWSGWKGHAWNWLPRAFSFQHTAAGLFTQRSTRWWDQHLEALDEKGEWHELAEQEVFPMGAFGYRSRYDRLLIESGRSRLATQVRQRLAEHVVHRLAEVDATHAEPIQELRLVRSYWTVGDAGLAKPEGRWSPPPIHKITGRDREVLGAYQLKNGVLEAVPKASATSVAVQSSIPTHASPVPNVKTPAVSAPGMFQRPGAPPPQSARNQITRRQVQRFVKPGLKPGMPLPLPVSPKQGGVDVSRLKLGQPGLPIQKMPETQRK